MYYVSYERFLSCDMNDEDLDEVSVNTRSESGEQGKMTERRIWGRKIRHSRGGEHFVL